MAQIRIEQRRTGLGWLWLLIALVVIAVVAWFIVGRSGARSAVPADSTTPSSLTTPSRPSSAPLPAA